jgi:hypothetical protein
VLRFYAFFLMILICAQLSILVCAVLEVNGGPSSTLESSAAQQLQLGVSTLLREQCEISIRISSCLPHDIHASCFVPSAVLDFVCVLDQC